MGLDNFFQNTDPSAPAMDFEPRLCGGMFSGHGQASFRGKVYNSFILFVTGESLYQDVIPNDKIKEMAQKLTEFYSQYPNDVIGDYNLSKEELFDLVRVFNYHAQHGSELVGWW